MKPSLDPHLLKRLSQPAPWSWCWRALSDWAQIIAVFVLLAHFPSVLTVVLAWLVVGIKMNALSLLGHDAAHFLVSRNRQLNDLIAYVFVGVPLGLSLSGYRKFHLEHHRHQGTAQDPEIPYQSAGPRWARPLSKQRLVYLFVTDLLGFGIGDIVKGLNCYKAQRKFEPLLSLLFFATAAYFCWRTGHLWVLGFWVFCSLTTHWALFRLRTLTEHDGMESTLRFSASPLLRYVVFPHNTHMHYEHHAYPTVPLWHLPEVRKNLRSAVELQGSQQLWSTLGRVPAFPW